MHIVRHHSQRGRRHSSAGQRGFAGGGLWMLLASILSVLALRHPVQAAVFHIPAGDVAALITAINTANGNGDDNTIDLAAGTYILTEVNNNTDGPNGLPSITGHLTMQGAGADHTIIAREASADAFRLVHVAAPGALTLDGLTVTGGRINAFIASGGIANMGGTLTLRNSTVSGNFGERTGGIENSGTLILLNSTVRDNLAPSGAAGGILNVNSSTLTLLNSTVNDNIAGGAGGLFNFGGTLTLLNSTVSGNLGDEGAGGIINTRGTLTLRNSTITDNTVGFLHALPHMGGVLNLGGTMVVTHSIIVGNSFLRMTSSDGDPFFVLDRGAECLDAENHDEGIPLGQSTSLGHNLVAGGCRSNGPGDRRTDPNTVFATVLGPLQHNGGPTQTHALLPNSPAIDAGDTVCTDANGTPLPTDQRGKPRPVDGNEHGTPACDIGAFEFFPLLNHLVTLASSVHTSFQATPVLDAPAGTFTITATFTNTSRVPLRFPFFGVSQLTDGNLLLNADGGSGGIGATLTLDVGDAVLAVDEAVTVDFVIGLQTRARFTFLIDLFGESVR